ncbi:DUF6493 family protein [Actinoplanes teichomyceticus]|uniref:Secreted protein n=1 Tax=Actinoplanes teichomyceticus TaxID=1867 RepID=A0A561WLU4_ACTTI|nr:DUF6493 family protein [Actinoplanes teichomyceticus]TWG24834.1 hypothetical protein FHX34_1021397 [Actinoplanes teichomyceticus]GIF15634.1 hypothetical protein Ate01nite_56660 [Actinoplanes teichomyceticus]
MILSWEILQRHARRGHRARIVALLAGATEQHRLALAGDVEAGIRRAERNAWWRADVNPNPGYALAVIGCMPTAARAAALLSRGAMQAWTRVGPDRFLEVARLRQVPWLGELGRRLAERIPLRDADQHLWPMIAELLRAGGAEPPVRENVVRAWLANLLEPVSGRRGGRSALGARLRDDPLRDSLLPALFECDGLGADLAGGSWDATAARWDPTPRVPAVIADLVADGVLARKTVLDLTLDRLARGGRAPQLRPFALLHDALEPTLDELSSHVLDYARLLPEAPGPVATLAQKALRAVDDAGRLELSTLLEASAPTLLRAEKTLVTAQLSWLERVARRHPGRAGEVLETVAAGFGHPALDVQERALTLIGRRAGGLDRASVARIADAAAALSGDLPARAAELFGTAVPAPAGIRGPGPAAPPAEMPPPIATPAELAEELAALCHEQTAVRWERVLAGLVALYTTAGPPALAAALRPVLDRYPGHFADAGGNESSPLMYLGLAIRCATGARTLRSRRQRLVTSVRAAWQDGRRGGPDSPLAATPDGVLALRLAEAAVQLSSTLVPVTVATPTHVTGGLDAAVLLERLRRAEAEGWQPWPVDFEQALLRLPRRTDPAVAAAATRLTSPAGRQFAAWLAAGGLPDPISSRFEQHPSGYRHTWYSPLTRRVVAAVRPARDGGLRLERQLLTVTPGAEPDGWPRTFHECGDVLAMVLPQHREVAAAWALPELAALADQEQRAGAALLPLLAECSGPVGPALAYGLAYALGARHQQDRVAAVDAFCTLAAGPEPFAPAVGAALADLCADATVKLSRLVPALAGAHRGGASAAVWDILTAVLPVLLPTARRGLPDLLELSTQVAGTVRAAGTDYAAGTGQASATDQEAGTGDAAGAVQAGRAGAGAPIPGLAEVAARPGSTRLVKEARRLQTVLTS